MPEPLGSETSEFLEKEHEDYVPDCKKNGLFQGSELKH